jgi:hypothetical protein
LGITGRSKLQGLAAPITENREPSAPIVGAVFPSNESVLFKPGNGVGNPARLRSSLLGEIIHP